MNLHTILKEEDAETAQRQFVQSQWMFKMLMRPPLFGIVKF